MKHQGGKALSWKVTVSNIRLRNALVTALTLPFLLAAMRMKRFLITPSAVFSLLLLASIVLPSAELIPGTPNNGSDANKPAVAHITADTKTHTSVVAPFLNTYCTSCHGASKAKGEVRLDIISAALAQGKA
jgi:hypothetical protein